MDNFNLKKYLSEGRLFKENFENDENQLSLFPDFEEFEEKEEIEFHSLPREDRKKYLISLGMSEEDVNLPQYQEAINNGDLKTLANILGDEYEKHISNEKSKYLNLIKKSSQELENDPEIQSILNSLKKLKDKKLRKKQNALLSKTSKTKLPQDVIKYYPDIASMLKTGKLADGLYVKRDKFGRYRPY